MLPTKSMGNHWMSRKLFLKMAASKVGEADKAVGETKTGATQVSIQLFLLSNIVRLSRNNIIISK